MGYLEELGAITTTPPTGAFTATAARIAAKLNDSTVRRKLAADVASGRLETGTFLVGGHHTRYFWEAKDAKVRKR